LKRPNNFINLPSVNIASREHKRRKPILTKKQFIALAFPARNQQEPKRKTDERCKNRVREAFIFWKEILLRV
jgi:hypothetical protein